MRRTGSWLGRVAFLCLLGVAHGEETAAPPDAFAQALEAMGIGEADLGYRPRGSWARYPTLETTPHVLPFFADLHARPLTTYEFVRTLAEPVVDLLTSEALLAAPTGEDKRETLYRLGVRLATERRIGGIRGYGSNLSPNTAPTHSLAAAVATLLERAGAPDAGAAALERLRSEVSAVPEALHLPLARLLLNLVDARVWVDRGFRRVPTDARESVRAAFASMVEEQEESRYYHEFDDVAPLVDEHSLHYGCLKCLQAVQDARRQIRDATPTEGWPLFEWSFQTPWGRVHVDSVAEERRVDGTLLVVRLNAEGATRGDVGATGPGRTVSCALLVGGAGAVGDEEGTGRVASGILGCGVVYDAGGGRAWTTGRAGLGAGVFGLGALVDEGGNDTYRAKSFAMGAGMFGAGLLLDAAGDDRYALLEGDGQGYGGPAGIGIVGDRRGDDEYYAEWDAAKAGRADYHSEMKVAYNMAQGAGVGRRGDLSDGHNWAGGLGALLDAEGHDVYKAGNFTQGLGFWCGTGILWDGGGDDEYRSIYFTQGSGAHFAIGVLVDESGDDFHYLSETAGAAFGFGWDVVNAFLIDRGAGRDRYEAKKISFGMAMVRSNAFFFDEGGDDLYAFAPGAQGFGEVDERPEYLEPGRGSTFPYHLGQVGVFLDLGGADRYERRNEAGGASPDAAEADGKTWRVRSRSPGPGPGPNVAIGRDLERGRIGFLDPYPLGR